MEDVNKLIDKYGGPGASENFKVWMPEEGTAVSKWLKQQTELKVAVLSTSPYLGYWLEKGMGFGPVVDDMAQIVGPNVELVNETEKGLKKALKSSAGAIVKTGYDDMGKATGYTVTAGRNLYEAIVALTVLEKSAEIQAKCQVVGGGVAINPIEARLMRLIYKKKYSKAEQKVKNNQVQANEIDAKEAKMEEKTSCYSQREGYLREKLVEYGNKLVSMGLVQGTWGNISVRLDEDNMLCTPSGLDYTRLTAGDMVKVNVHTLEYEGDLKPTSEKGLHAKIYENRADVGAVIHTHSKYASIFAAARKNMPIESQNGRAVFGDEVRLAKYALPGTKALMNNTQAAVGENFGAIMANHGMICCGKDIEDALNNCALLEECGREYIEKKVIL